MLRVSFTKMLLATSIALAGVACGASDTVLNPARRAAGPLAAAGTSATFPFASVIVASRTSPDGLITLTLSASMAQDTAGVNDSYAWAAHNNSTTSSVSGVTLGSNWGDYCGGTCTPKTPTLISLAPGCARQGVDEIPLSANFGAWCTPLAGVTLGPGETVTGAVTLRPGSGGPVNYIVYSLYNDPVTGLPIGVVALPVIHDVNAAAPAPVDEQLTGSASTGSPAVGASFNYNYQIKNSGPWGTFGGVAFTDSLPAAVTFVGYTATPGVSCSAVGQTVSCEIPDKINQNGQSTSISLTVTALATAQPIVNTATIAFTAPQADSDTRNNAVTISVTSK